MNGNSPQLIMQSIREQGLDSLCAWNMAKTDQLYFADGKTTDELCRLVDMLVVSISGPFNLEVWQGKRSQGRKAVGERYYRYVVEGRAGGYGQQPAADPRVDKLIEAVEKLTAQVGGDEDEDEEPNPEADRIGALVITALEKYVGGASFEAPSPVKAVAGPAAPAPAKDAAPPAEMTEAECADLLTKSLLFRQANPEAFAALKAQLDGMFPNPSAHGQG